MVVYRVAQEALVNAARHSGATRVEVSLEPRDSRVRLEVADNGSGFAFAEEGKGLGLSGMRERALLVGGSLDIDSRPGKGTSWCSRCPPSRLAGRGPGGLRRGAGAGGSGHEEYRVACRHLVMTRPTVAA